MPNYPAFPGSDDDATKKRQETSCQERDERQVRVSNVLDYSHGLNLEIDLGALPKSPIRGTGQPRGSTPSPERDRSRSRSRGRSTSQAGDRRKKKSVANIQDVFRPRARNPTLGGVREELADTPKTPASRASSRSPGSTKESQTPASRRESKTPGRPKKAQTPGTPRPKAKSRKKKAAQDEEDDSPLIFSRKIKTASRLFKTAVDFAVKSNNRDACSAPKFKDHKELKTEFLQLPETNLNLEEPSSASSATSFFPKTPTGGLLTPRSGFSSSQFLTPPVDGLLSAGAEEASSSQGRKKGKVARPKTPAQLEREEEKLQKELMSAAEKEVRADTKGEDARFFEFLSSATNSCKECRAKIIPGARRIKEILKKVNNLYHSVCFHRRMKVLEERVDTEEFHIGCWSSNWNIEQLFELLSTKVGRKRQKNLADIKMGCMRQEEKDKMIQEERRKMVEEYNSDDESDSGCGRKNLRRLQKARGVKNPAQQFARRTYAKGVHDVADIHVPHPASFANNAGYGDLDFLDQESANFVLRALDTPDLQRRFALLDEEQRKEVSKLEDEQCVRELMTLQSSKEVDRVLQLKDKQERQKLIMLDAYKRSELLAIRDANKRSEVLAETPIASVWNLEDNRPAPIANGSSSDNKSLRTSGQNLKNMLAAIQDRRDRKAESEERALTADAKENSAVKKDYPVLTNEERGKPHTPHVPKKQHRPAASPSSSHEVSTSKTKTTEEYVTSSSQEAPKNKSTTEDYMRASPSSRKIGEPRSEPVEKRPLPGAVAEKPGLVAAKARRNKLSPRPENDDDPRTKLRAEVESLLTASRSSSSSSSAVLAAKSDQIPSHQDTTKKPSVVAPSTRSVRAPNSPVHLEDAPAVVTAPSTRSVQAPSSPVQLEDAPAVVMATRKRSVRTPSSSVQWEDVPAVVIAASQRSVRTPSSPIQLEDAPVVVREVPVQLEDAPVLVKEVSIEKRQCRRDSSPPQALSSTRPVLTSPERPSPTADSRVTRDANALVGAWREAPSMTTWAGEKKLRAGSEAATAPAGNNPHRTSTSSSWKADYECKNPNARIHDDVLYDIQHDEASRTRIASTTEQAWDNRSRTHADIAHERNRNDAMMFMTPRTDARVSDLARGRNMTPRREEAFKLEVARLLDGPLESAPRQVGREDAAPQVPLFKHPRSVRSPRSDDDDDGATPSVVSTRRANRKTPSPNDYVPLGTRTLNGVIWSTKTTPLGTTENASKRYHPAGLHRKRRGGRPDGTESDEEYYWSNDSQPPSSESASRRRVRKTLSPEKHEVHEADARSAASSTRQRLRKTLSPEKHEVHDTDARSAASSTRQRLRKTLSPEKCEYLHEANAETRRVRKTLSPDNHHMVQEDDEFEHTSVKEKDVDAAAAAAAARNARSRRKTMSPTSIYGVDHGYGATFFEPASSSGAAAHFPNDISNSTSSSNLKSNPMIGTTCAQRVKLIKNGAYPGKKARDDNVQQEDTTFEADFGSLTQVVGKTLSSPTKSASPTSMRLAGGPPARVVDRRESWARGSVGSGSMSSTGASSSPELCQRDEPSELKIHADIQEREETRDISAKEREAEERAKQIKEAEREYMEQLEAAHQKELEKVHAKFEAEKEKKKLIWKQKLFQNEQDARSACKIKSAMLNKKEKEVSAKEKKNSKKEAKRIPQRETEEKKKPKQSPTKNCEKQQKKSVSDRKASPREGVKARQKKESVATKESKKPSAARKASTTKSRKMEKGQPVDDDDEEKEVDTPVKSHDDIAAAGGQQRAARRKSTSGYALWNQTQLQNAESRKKVMKKSR